MIRILAGGLIFFLIMQVTTIVILAIVLQMEWSRITGASFIDWWRESWQWEVAIRYFRETTPVSLTFSLLVSAVLMTASWARKLPWALLFTAGIAAVVLAGLMALTGMLSVPAASVPIYNWVEMVSPLVGSMLGALAVYRYRHHQV